MNTTVLMPVYNAEKYLHCSIGSLIVQTSNNWRLICVDDGSSDSSLDILLTYEKELNKGLKGDWKMKVLTQENAGPAVARARAIEIADTEYVSILDSDDAYAPDYVELMLKRAGETGADIVIPDVVCLSANKPNPKNTVFESRGYDKKLVITDSRLSFKKSITWELHAWCMYKTSFVKKFYTVCNVQYSRYNSDEYVARLLMANSSKTVLCEAIYRYAISEGSITRTPSLRMFDSLLTMDKVLQICIEKNVDTKVLVEFYNEYYQTIKNLNKTLCLITESERVNAEQMLNEMYNNSYKKHLSYRVIKAAPLRTKIKFALSIVSIKCIL